MRRSPWLLDIAIALAAAALSLSFVVGDLIGWRAVVASLLALAHTLPLAARRRWPGWVLSASLLSGFAFEVAGFPLVYLGPAVLVPIYTIAAYAARRTATLGLAATLAALTAAQVLPPRPTSWTTWFTNGLVLAGAWLLGRFAGERRAHIAELERARDQLARQAVAQERVRIARELHDVVAHSMSVIAVQSGVGGHVLDSQPEEARRALAAIEQTSRSALQEMRRLLAVLRTEEPAGAATIPMPSLLRVDELIVPVRQAGVRVDLVVEGERPDLPAGVDLSAYRIVQEALSNVLQHAHATYARVAVRYTAREVFVEIRDDGAGEVRLPPDRLGGSGHGLPGMRERAELYGGEMSAEPLPDGGFRVAARLPVGPVDQR